MSGEVSAGLGEFVVVLWGFAFSERSFFLLTQPPPAHKVLLGGAWGGAGELMPLDGGEVEGTEVVPAVEVVEEEVVETMGGWGLEVVEEALEVTEEDTEAVVEEGEADCVDQDQNYDLTQH